MQVPTDYVQNVMPQGRLEPERLDVNPNEFGAQVGQAVERLGATAEQAGNMLAQHAVERQKLLNAANVDDVYANQFDPAFRQKYMDFLKLKGKDAEAAFPQFQQEMHDLLTETAQSLPNQMQQHTFNEVARRRMMSDLDGMARHAAAETNSWIGQTTEATGGVYMNRIVDNRNDPNKVAGFVNSINNLYSAQGQITDQDPVVYNAKAANVIDSGISRAINTELELSPENAQNLLDQYGKFLSNDGVRADLANRIQPKLQVKQEQDVYGYVYNLYGIGNPDSNINDAISAVMDPNQFTHLSNQQRNEIAHTISAEWNRTRQVRNDEQKTVNEGFEDGVLKGTIPPRQIINYVDPKTGIAPDAKTRENVLSNWVPKLDHLGELKKSDPGTLTDLTDAVSDRLLLDRGPINDAYANGHITEADWKNLRNTQDIMQDKSKTRWWTEVDQLYKSRYQDNLGNWASPEARMLYPQFISNLDDAIREQNLKGHQVIEMANKMLEPVDSQIVSSVWHPSTWGGAPQPALDFAAKWGGWPKPVINAPQNPPGVPAAPTAPAATPPAAPSKYEQYLRDNGYPVTPANIKALQDQEQSRGVK
jgi:hypothetical protein